MVGTGGCFDIRCCWDLRIGDCLQNSVKMFMNPFVGKTFSPLFPGREDLYALPDVPSSRWPCQRGAKARCAGYRLGRILMLSA